MTLISFYLFILIGRFITSKTERQIGKTVDTQTQIRKLTDTDTHTHISIYAMELLISNPVFPQHHSHLGKKKQMCVRRRFAFLRLARGFLRERERD